jgi:hypothetical protein
MIEKTILKPRLINFANFILTGLEEYEKSGLTPKMSEQAAGYSALLFYFANGRDAKVYLPDRYSKKLQIKLKREVALIREAKNQVVSPIFNVKIDYREFKIPDLYKGDEDFYRLLKLSQIIPVPKDIKRLIKISERLTNLYNQIREQIDLNFGINKRAKGMFPALKGLDYYIKDIKIDKSEDKNQTAKIDKNKDKNQTAKIDKNKSEKSKLSDIKEETKDPILALMKKEYILNRGLSLKNNYDYHIRVIQTLIDNNYTDAAKGYLLKLSSNKFLYKDIKNIRKRERNSVKTADIDLNIEATLDIMIEDILMFQNSITFEYFDKKMLNILRDVRRVIQKRKLKIKLSKEDIKLLNNLDLRIAKLLRAKDREVTVDINKNLKIKVLATPIKKEKGLVGGKYKINILQGK